MQTEEKDWKQALSFLIMLTSPATLLIIMLGIPMFVGFFINEQSAFVAMIIGFIIFALAMFFALNHLDLD